MIQNRITMTYDHTDGRTFTLVYERFDDGWTVDVHDPASTDDLPTMYFDDWRCWAERSNTDWSDVVEVDPSRSFRRILGHYLNTEVTGPWHTLSTTGVTVTMGGVR